MCYSEDRALGKFTGDKCKVGNKDSELTREYLLSDGLTDEFISCIVNTFCVTLVMILVTKDRIHLAVA